MNKQLAARFRPVAPPRIIEGAYTEDQHRRLIGVVREHGPWPLILAHHFKMPEEVVATTSGELPPGFVPTWDMLLSPVFRGGCASSSTGARSSTWITTSSKCRSITATTSPGSGRSRCSSPTFAPGVMRELSPS